MSRSNQKLKCVSGGRKKSDSNFVLLICMFLSILDLFITIYDIIIIKYYSVKRHEMAIQLIILNEKDV